MGLYELDYPGGQGTEGLASRAAANVAAYDALGLRVHITEADCLLPTTDPQGFCPENATDVAAQARLYRALAGACADAHACTAFVVWGFTYNVSW